MKLKSKGHGLGAWARGGPFNEHYSKPKSASLSHVHALSGALLVLGAWPAAATTDADTNAATEQSVLQEVVVTAEKRESTVQKVPISMTAITGHELARRGISDLLTVAQETPGVSLETAGPGQTEYEIRGLPSSGGYSPTVGFYLDDVPLTSAAQSYLGKIVIDPDLYDLNRVEVLRGPQGTLYGSGSMGGTIKPVTNGAVLNKFESTAQVTGSGTEGGGFNHGASGMVNIPLAKDVLALRIVGTDKYKSGWIDRIVLNPFPEETNGGLTRGNVLAAPIESKADGVNWERIGGARANLVAQLGDQLTITPEDMWQRISQGGAPPCIASYSS